MKKIVWLLLLSLFGCMLSGCNEEEAVKAEGQYYLYYTNMEENGLEREIYTATNTQTEGLIEEFMTNLVTPPQENANVNLLPMDVQIRSYQYENSNVNIDMSREYSALPISREVLIRAGLVRTLVQIDGVNSVTMTVEGAPLTNSKGQEIGRMTDQTFVENSGKEINSYLNTTLTLYFANEEGDKLIPESRRLYYSSNVPLERVVVEQLVRGPRTMGLFPVLSPDVTILGVTSAEGICYVNFGSNFQNQVLSVRQEIPIYAIVNSLIDNCNVQQVQISVDGESNLIFRESMDLNQFYEKNNSLVEES